MITIVTYIAAWPGEFVVLGTALRAALGQLALRIDHIGSTAVPGLAAKDIIDIQVTVASFEQPIDQALHREGYRRLEHIQGDHIPPGAAKNADDWRKWFFKAPPDRRPVHLHVRLAGRANQRYPLLFRDYLRTHGAVAQAYAQIKTALAERLINNLQSDNLDAYYAVKDPVCDIIIAGAEGWAAQIGWEPPPSDC